MLLISLMPWLTGHVAGQNRTVLDPVSSFVRGFNPTDEDFFAQPSGQTVLLRMRLDLDGDGRPDVALSESSVFGVGGGPWLVFRTLPGAGAYRYVGEVFAAPGDLRIQPGAAGSELVAGSALSADVTHLVRYRLAADTIVLLAERDTSGGSPPAPDSRVERCRLADYQRDALHCWHAGPE